MKVHPLLPMAILAIVCMSGCCAREKRPSTRPPGVLYPPGDYEFNSRSGNFERNPPYGPRSNKTL